MIGALILCKNRNSLNIFMIIFMKSATLKILNNNWKLMSEISRQNIGKLSINCIIRLTFLWNIRRIPVVSRRKIIMTKDQEKGVKDSKSMIASHLSAPLTTMISKFLWMAATKYSSTHSTWWRNSSKLTNYKKRKFNKSGTALDFIEIYKTCSYLAKKRIQIIIIIWNYKQETKINNKIFRTRINYKYRHKMSRYHQK